MKRVIPHFFFSVAAVPLRASLGTCVRAPLALLLFALSAQAFAQGPAASVMNYPAKPIRFIVPFAAGGGTDFMTRLFGQKMSEAWGQQVVADNRPGAAGILGTDIAAKAVPDGYTLVMASGSHNANPSLYKKLPYDAIRDFAPVTLIAHCIFEVTPAA